MLKDMINIGFNQPLSSFVVFGTVELFLYPLHTPTIPEIIKAECQLLRLPLELSILSLYCLKNLKLLILRIQFLQNVKVHLTGGHSQNM